MDVIKKTAIAAIVAVMALPVYAHNHSGGHHKGGHHTSGHHHGGHGHHGKVIVVSGGGHHRHHHGSHWVNGNWKYVTVCGKCCHRKRVWID